MVVASSTTHIYDQSNLDTNDRSVKQVVLNYSG